MAIPDYQTCMRPALELLDTVGELRSRDVKDKLADHFALSDEERAAVLPSGHQRVIDSRVGWALTYLSQAGLVNRPRRGVIEITPRGREVLAGTPGPINTAHLDAFPEFQEFRNRTRASSSPGLASSAPQSNTPAVPAPEGDTPEDLLTRAVQENRIALEHDVLNRALALSPIGFEDLVIALLDRMGYGKAGSVERTSATGDAGVDGIISQDPLGLDRIYVQAKRYARDNVIHRPKIHEFAGALLGKQGDRGVYITTSSFSEGALREADRINARIELIDGRRLAELLVKYRVGVQVEHTVELLQMDEDFYEGL